MSARAPVLAAAGLAFALCLAWSGTASAQLQGPGFPDWSYHLELWPFDILYPATTRDEITERLEAAVAAGANATIVYLEEEHMYGSFVDEAGFARMLELLETLVAEAHRRELRVIVYLNGLEVMTHDAVDPETCAPRPGPTMARVHPDWLQIDLDGEAIDFDCLDLDWLAPDMEDAWVSPFSPYRDLFVERLEALGSVGPDGVYIDATFLPGLQVDEDEPRWGTTDPAAAADFEARTGFAVPAEPDWSEPAWRAWLGWRHEVLRDYLADLAAASRNAGMVPFWESSTNDTPDATLLGNETAITALAGLGFSPEIEPEGDWLAAFRMMQAARDFLRGAPLLYLGWPVGETEAAYERAIALAFSGNLYPTADAPYPADVFGFADRIRDEVLRRRRVHAGRTALVYSVRNKDLTWEESTHFDAYDDAFRDLTQAHVPFTILVLERLAAADLAPFETVVLPGLVSLSEAEHALLDGLRVVLVDEVGTHDENGCPRPAQLAWSRRLNVDLDALPSGLPFELEAPPDTWIAWYEDGSGGFFLFAVHGRPGTEMTVRAERPLAATVWRPESEAQELSGFAVSLLTHGALSVWHVRSLP